MGKQEFLEQLRKSLSGLPQGDIEERVAFYDEMLEDRMEEGFSEAEAVEAAGSVEKIAMQTVAEIPLTKIAKERIKPKRQLRVWEIVLIVLGSPVWLPLFFAVIAVLSAIYISLWAVIISLWSAFGGIVCGALGGLVEGIILACTGHGAGGVALIGAGIACAGLAIFAFFGCMAATKGIVMLTKKFALMVKGWFIKKENV